MLTICWQYIIFVLAQLFFAIVDHVFVWWPHLAMVVCWKVLQSVGSHAMFLLDVYQCFRSPAAATSRLKLETAGCSDMLVLTYQTTWHHISEDHVLDIHCFAKLKLYQNPTNNFEMNMWMDWMLWLQYAFNLLSSHSYNFLDVAVHSNMKNKFSMLVWYLPRICPTMVAH